MDERLEKGEQKLTYEQSLHSMTKEKLIWSNKDKFKLQNQIAGLERAHKRLEEKYRGLDRKHRDFLREYRDAENQIKALERGTSCSNLL